MFVLLIITLKVSLLHIKLFYIQGNWTTLEYDMSGFFLFCCFFLIHVPHWENENTKLLIPDNHFAWKLCTSHSYIYLKKWTFWEMFLELSVAEWPEMNRVLWKARSLLLNSPIYLFTYVFLKHCPGWNGGKATSGRLSSCKSLTVSLP